MHHLIKHPALAVVAILVVAINFSVATKPRSGSTYDLTNSFPHSSMNVPSVAADQDVESAEIAQDYALATGAWMPPSMSVQSNVPSVAADQDVESAEIAQDYALATGAWMPPSMSVQSNVPSVAADQDVESAEIAQDYALATGAWIPPRLN